MFIHQLLLQTNVMWKIQACHYMNFMEYVIKLTMNATTKMNIMKLCCQ